MRIKVSLQNKQTGEALLHKVVMRFDGNPNNLNDLIAALKETKAECNKVANEAKLALRKCEASVEIL